MLKKRFKKNDYKICFTRFKHSLFLCKGTKMKGLGSNSVEKFIVVTRIKRFTINDCRPS